MENIAEKRSDGDIITKVLYTERRSSLRNHMTGKLYFSSLGCSTCHLWACENSFRNRHLDGKIWAYLNTKTMWGWSCFGSRLFYQNQRFNLFVDLDMFTWIHFSMICHWEDDNVSVILLQADWQTSKRVRVYCGM